MHLKSLREFIEALKTVGAVQPIEVEVDWKLEIGAITRRSYELRAPAPLFNCIRGIKDGLRVFGAPGGLNADPRTRFARVALALGLPADTPGRTIVETLAASTTRPGVPPRYLPTGPCKENITVGPDVDLLRFPTPLIHGSDGGRYIQTYGLNIVRTPDGAWTNWSINRMMLLDRNRLACLIPPNQHFGIIHSQWRAIGKATPIVVALGVEPGLPYVGGMSAPEGVDESHVLGAHFGEPIEMVRGETVDLPVPATAEIVIEGHVSHEEVAPEGPMGEYPGYLDVSPAKPKPVLNVTAVTWRHQAILPVVAAGPPVEEDHTGWGMPHAAMCLRDLRAAGLPVSGAWMVLESACHWMLIAVSPDWHERTGLASAALAQRVGEVLFPTKTGFGIPKVLLVEDDFDFTDINQVVWAFATRAHPHHGEIEFPGMAQNNLPVFLDSEEKFTYRATKVIHNCLLADRYALGERPITANLKHGWPPELVARVIANWGRYGFPEPTQAMSEPRRMIVGVTGATGIVYAACLLEALRGADIETHLVVTKPAEMTAAHEWPRPLGELRSLAARCYPIGDIGAAIASGSFRTMGMIVAPCSARTVAEIAYGVSSNLLTRAADVCLKERRRLVLMMRETPLHAGHLKAMLAATEAGAIIAPVVPAFYAQPQTLQDVVDHTVGRVLDLFDIETTLVGSWVGHPPGTRRADPSGR